MKCLYPFIYRFRNAFVISFLEPLKSKEEKGIRFVQAFKQVMSKCKPDQDFVSILTETNNKIAQDLAGKKAKVELPCIISTLTKKLVFCDK